uniref:Uncharacterized protein n=1 Tax=Quercus lobata TaxID=97700 RepID=A0A7N2MRH4_QUELO
MAIIGLGLLLFALLIGNMQNFLQALGRRRLEMSLRRRDVEQWMSHRRLPEELRRQVRQAERYNWAATRGVNEEILLENLPEDLQRDIRRHLCKFVKKAPYVAYPIDMLHIVRMRFGDKSGLTTSNSKERDGQGDNDAEEATTEQCHKTHEVVVGASRHLKPSKPGFVVVVRVGMRDWRWMTTTNVISSDGKLMGCGINGRGWPGFLLFCP